MRRNRRAAEFVSIHGAHAGTNALIRERAIDVRELPEVRWRERAKAVVDDRAIVNVGDVDDVEAAAASAPPRVVPIARTDRQPTNTAESEAESNSHTPPAVSPTEEGDVCGSP
jgi:hypothetical protein